MTRASASRVVCTLESHHAAKQDLNLWSLMPYVGKQEGNHRADPPYDLELRNCTCGSTLAIRIPVTSALDKFDAVCSDETIPAKARSAKSTGSVFSPTA